MATPPEERITEGEQAIQKELGDFEAISARLQKRMLTATWTIAGVTAIYVGVTALLLLVGAKQLEIMRNQLTDARNAASESQKNTERQFKMANTQNEFMKTLADANKAMADAAKMSAGSSARIARSTESGVKATRESVHLDQRPWVGVSDYLSFQFEVGKPLSAVFIITNTGRTPALNVQYHYWTEYRHFGDPTKQNNALAQEPPSSGSIQSKDVLQPNARTAVQVARGPIIEQERFDAINSSRARLYFRCVIRYEDVFRQPHKTNYCGVWSPQENGVAACAEGNYAD